MRSFIFLFIMIVIGIGNLYSSECHVNKSKKNLVKFISDAPIEDFEGKTKKIDGYIFIESMEKLVGSKMYFEVDLKSLDTGIGLRNRHMRENYLHTDKYPFSHFEGEITEAIPDSENRYKVVSEGKIFIHGVSKKIKAEAFITTNGNGSYRIQAKFVVALTDFNIEVPEMMFFKIDEKMDLALDFYVLEVKD